MTRSGGGGFCGGPGRTGELGLGGGRGAQAGPSDGSPSKEARLHPGAVGRGGSWVLAGATLQGQTNPSGDFC